MTSDEEDDAEAERIAREWGVRDQDQSEDLIRLGLGDRPMHWAEDGRGGVVPVPLMVWARNFETTDRVVQQDWVYPKWLGSHYFVSTVFLGTDHNWLMFGPPILYETMIFRHRFLHVLLARLRLDMFVWRWDRFCARVLFRWNISLPTIADANCEWQWRYATRAEALAGHLRIVDMVRRGVPSHQWGEAD